MENELIVAFRGGIGFDVSARQHKMTIDLSKEKGGEDLGFNPPEVFMASLGSCIGVYVARYCQNVKLDASGLKISVSWKLSDDKTWINEISAKVSLPNADLGARGKAVLEVAKHCLIHNTILNSPKINISLG